MIRIIASLTLQLLCLQLLICHVQSANRRLAVSQGPLQVEIENCIIPNTSTPNILSLGMCPGQIFIMPLSLGTPPQPLYFIANTGQSLIQVLTNQTNQTGFNISQSSTAQVSNEVVFIELGNGNTVPALVGNDFVSLNNSNISSSSDLLIVNQQVQNIYSGVISGVAGLGISDAYPNIFEIAYANGQINTATYILSLNATSNQSYLYYNQLPAEIINNSTFIDSYSDDFYSLLIIGFFVGGTQFTSGGPDYAVLSSSNSYLDLPQKLYYAVVGKFFSDCISTSSGPSCSCDATIDWPTFSIMFAGAQIYIPASSYTTNLSNGNCSYGFGFIQNDDDTMILGTSFFINYNLTFNPLEPDIGMQGNLTPIQVIDFEYFVICQYIFFIIALAMAICAGVLVWYLKLVEKEKSTRVIQFSISDRFIETE